MNKLLIATLSIGALTLGAANAADMRAPVKAPAPVAVRAGLRPVRRLLCRRSWWLGYYRHDYADRGNIAQTIDDDLPTSANIAGDGNWLGGASESAATGSATAPCSASRRTGSWTGVEGERDLLGRGRRYPGAALDRPEQRMRWFGTATDAAPVSSSTTCWCTSPAASLTPNFKRSYTHVRGCAAPPRSTFSSSSTRWGWTAGVGTEWAMERQLEHRRAKCSYMRFVNHDSTVHRHNRSIPSISVVPGRGYQHSGSQDDSVWITPHRSELPLGRRARWSRATDRSFSVPELRKPRPLAGAFRLIGLRIAQHLC